MNPPRQEALTPRPLLQLQQLHKQFANGPEVLHDINLQVSTGQIIAVVGPSGCGKSTLLRIIAGLSSPTRGGIHFDCGSSALNPENRPEMAFIFQSATLLPWLNVRDNIALVLRLRGLARPERLKRAAQLAAQVQLQDALHLYPRQLSGGMRMRVSLARAFSGSPRLLLFDEPFGALDAITRQQLNETLLQMHQREKWTAFFVTHSVNEAVFLAHKVVILSRQPGKIHRILDVPLPFPRNAGMRNNTNYLQLVVAANQRLQEVLEQP